MRLIVSAVVAIIVTGLLFTMMNALVSSPSRIDKGVDNQSIIDFVRLKQDSKTQTKNRDKKEPPKPKKPDLPPTESIQQSNDVSQMNIDMPDEIFSIVEHDGKYNVGNLVKFYDLVGGSLRCNN